MSKEKDAKFNIKELVEIKRKINNLEKEINKDKPMDPASLREIWEQQKKMDKENKEKDKYPHLQFIEDFEETHPDIKIDPKKTQLAILSDDKKQVLKILTRRPTVKMNPNFEKELMEYYKKHPEEEPTAVQKRIFAKLEAEEKQKIKKQNK